ncbi:MAG: SDR family NAD(P)-dependent oxidoreductase [Thiolinea sp.]
MSGGNDWASTLFDLSGKTALITAPASALAAPLAQGLAAHGAHVIVNGRNADRAQQVADEIRQQGGQASMKSFDVTDAAAVNQAIAELEAQQPIDILVNNAGMQYRTLLEDFPDEQWELLLKTITSAYLVGKAVGRHMIPRQSGKIINIASVQSELARPGIAPYTTTKGAIRNLTSWHGDRLGKTQYSGMRLVPGYFKTAPQSGPVRRSGLCAWLKAHPAGRWGKCRNWSGSRSSRQCGFFVHDRPDPACGWHYRIHLI